ncbi:MAG: cation transporter [Candidatus Omnitrophica bacterium]|nr:cation transporter [Candidatus Omnitrophota bacterium]
MIQNKCVKCAKTVPWMVLLGNTTLSAFQIIVGTLAGSKGLIADGIHSGTDVLCTIMVIITVGLSEKKSDKKYPWGRGKSEFLGAVFAYTLLLYIAIVILWDAGLAIASGNIHPPHPAAVFCAIVAILANYILSSYGFCAGKKMNSPALIANANENRSDMISSIGVTIGIFLANLGITILDSLAAFFVGLMIGRMAIKLGIAALKNLIDESLPADKKALIEKVIMQYREVKGINYMHVRRVGQQAWVDMEIFIDPQRTVEEGHAITREVRAALLRRFIQIKDVTLTFTCRDNQEETKIGVIRSPKQVITRKQLNPVMQ